MNSLPIAGITIRIAWGRTIRRMVCRSVMPSRMTKPPTRTSQVATKISRNRSRAWRRDAATARTIDSAPTPSPSGPRDATGATIWVDPQRTVASGLPACHRQVNAEPLHGHRRERSVGVHVVDDLLQHRDEVGVGRSALVDRHGQRLEENGIADLDERQPGLDRAVDGRARAQPAIEVEPTRLPLVRPVRVG